MISLIAIFLLLLAPAVMLIIHLLRPAFTYHWLIAALAALLAWPMVLLSGLAMPYAIPLLIWNRQPLFGANPALQIDGVSWPFALASATLIFAILFTAVARARQGNWMSWAGSCTLTAFGLVAVQAGNPLTLLLAWAAIDLAELAILLVQVYESDARESIVVAFSARVGGILLLIAAGVAAQMAGPVFDFATTSPAASLLIVMSAGLRLGVLPINLPNLKELPLLRGLGVSIRLVPAASSLVLLVRVSSMGSLAWIAPWLVGLAALVGLYAALSWVAEKDELAARPYWVLCFSTFIFAAAVRGQTAAALAWSLACLLPGALLFLANVRGRLFLPFAALGLVGFSALPFTPVWSGADIFSPTGILGQDLSLLLFLLSLALLMAGYARYAFRPGESLAGTERWVWAIYLMGLALLPLTHFLLGWRLFSTQANHSLAGWLAGLLGLGLAAGLWSLRTRSKILPVFRKVWGKFFSLAWFYRAVSSVYQGVRRILDGVSLLLEGEAGILWAFLILALILSLIVPGVPGG